MKNDYLPLTSPSNAPADEDITPDKLRTSQMTWWRTTQGAQLSYQRRMNEAWSEYQRQASDIANSASTQYLNAADQLLAAAATGNSASDTDVSSSLRDDMQAKWQEAAQKMRSAQRKFAETQQQAWLDASDAYQKANDAFLSETDSLQRGIFAAINMPGMDEGTLPAFGNQMFLDPMWGYRWG